MLRIGVLVSGGGTNLQALIDAASRGEIPKGKIVCVISDREGAFALDRAKAAGIQTETILKKSCACSEEFDLKICAAMKNVGVELVVLAGFLSILGKSFTEAYKDSIINVHPSLIPSFCGPGYYGLKVHKAALDYGVKVTGATVHFVNEVVDGGRIILQKAVYIEDGDTPETLQRRVMEEAEWQILPRAVAMVCEERCGKDAE